RRQGQYIMLRKADAAVDRQFDRQQAATSHGGQRLATAGFADHRQELAFIQGEVDTGDERAGAGAYLQVLHRQEAGHLMLLNLGSIHILAMRANWLTTTTVTASQVIPACTKG